MNLQNEYKIIAWRIFMKIKGETIHHSKIIFKKVLKIFLSDSLAYRFQAPASDTMTGVLKKPLSPLFFPA